MISVKNIKFYGDIPDEWIFEHYLNLKEPLIGQDVKLLSVFNSKDKVPSMFVYYDLASNKYKFKDFSSGKLGSAIDLVKELYGLSYAEAIFKIQNDYNENPVCKERVLIKHDKFKVTDYEIRHWNIQDKKYWTKFKLNSKILEKYDVAPLSFYTMSKTDLDGSVQTITKSYQNIYGYFNKEGELIKIYQPTIKEQKFIKVKNYLQGWDQLKFQHDYLVLTASLKDLMCFDLLGFDIIEKLAPDSENSMISKLIIDKLKTKYKKIFVLFDNDEPGNRSADKYVDVHGFIKLELKLSKDLSDSVKDHGVTKIKEVLIKEFKKHGLFRKS
jgi:hypothetical protein